MAYHVRTCLCALRSEEIRGLSVESREPMSVASGKVGVGCCTERREVRALACAEGEALRTCEVAVAGSA